MTVSIILTSHMKPTLGDAIWSVVTQTRKDYDLLVVDSGKWVDSGNPERDQQMRDIYRDHRIYARWFTTQEPDDLRQHKCPVSWATNNIIRAGEVRGEYVCHFYDDDLMYPTFIEKMAGYLDEHPEDMAVLCAQDRLTLARDGTTSKHGLIAPHGRLGPGQFDCRVDGAQIMYRREVLDAMGDPWMDERPGDCGHSDGLFLERLAGIAGSVPAIPDVLLAHRNTPFSTYSPS